MVTHPSYKKECSLCGCRIYKEDKHELVIVETPKYKFEGGLCCGDCWSFLVELAAEHRDEFIHNKIKIRSLRRKEYIEERQSGIRRTVPEGRQD